MVVKKPINQLDDFIFEKDIRIRLRKEEYDKILLCVAINQGKYESLSHFVRVAVIKLINSETRLKNNKRRTK